jgi:Lipoprotein LpqB beta-propeller domain
VKRLLAVIASVLLLAACTGVPSSSSPQTVEPLQLGPSNDIVSTGPEPNAGAGAIVSGFLAAGVTAADKHASARAYLSPGARNRWSDNTVTIISDESVSTYDAAKRTVTVFGKEVGTVNASGIYTPSLLGEGDGGTRVPFQFTLTKVAGQYRVDQLRPGLLLTDDQFRSGYAQRVLYFYDDAEDHLVPDPRYSPLDDPAQVADWLLTQLVNGPRPDLENTVRTDTLPAQADAQHTTIDLGTPTVIEIPGSSQLDPAVRDRLAAQVSKSLDDAVNGGEITITDGGVRVKIPEVGGALFRASDFPLSAGPQPPAPTVYYLAQNRVQTEAGKPLPGPLGDGTYALTSMALSRLTPSGQLLAAGVEGTGPGARLYVGNQTAGLRQTSVQGSLSRPAFVPGRSEVWIGQGSQVVRVTIDGTTSHATPVSIPAVSGGGRILALRLSPEGSRIAIVVSGAGGSSQLYLGSIARTAGQVQVDSLQTISPVGTVITDVAWLDPLQLLAIGYLKQSGDSETFETGVDGSEWTNRGVGTLSYAPKSVTVAPLAPAWVSANGFVWRQRGSDWVSPVGTDQTPGTNPVYVE